MTSWRQTRFTERLGAEYPIVQGPFGSGLSSAGLAAAVANAGGLGSYGAHILSPAEIRALAADLRTRTRGPFNLNLWVPLPGEREQAFGLADFRLQNERLRPFTDPAGLTPREPPTSYAPQRFEDQLAAVIEAAPPVASFVFGIPPTDALRALQQRGTVTVGAATTVEEAIALEAAGFDMIVASGSDAGGHRPSFLRPAMESLVGTMALVPQVVDAVRIPVIAAGGIADGRGIAAALALGAAAAQIGTAFLACDESNASAVHKAALVTPDARRTRLTRAFTGRLARGIANRLMDEVEQAIPEPPPYPIHAWFMSPISRAGINRGDAQGASLWAGQAAGLVKRRPAAECFRALVESADRCCSDVKRLAG